MPNMALAILTGHLGPHIELVDLPSGKKVLKFSLCVNTGWKAPKLASWYSCAMFGNNIEKLAPMLFKGKAITVVGEPSIRKWEANGKTGTSVEVNVRDVVLLGAPGGQKEEGATEENTDDSGVPF